VLAPGPRKVMEQLCNIMDYSSDVRSVFNCNYSAKVWQAKRFVLVGGVTTVCPASQCSYRYLGVLNHVHPPLSLHIARPHAPFAHSLPMSADADPRFQFGQRVGILLVTEAAALSAIAVAGLLLYIVVRRLPAAPHD
jgi:hypothetical protein